MNFQGDKSRIGVSRSVVQKHLVAQIEQMCPLSSVFCLCFFAGLRNCCNV